jgi:CheY-like chemotaxis protein
LARKILLADDSVTAQNMGRKILSDAGYEVITVNNGSAALKKIAEHKPDLIVLDIYMPGYSGLEVCLRLKENRETARIPVLLTVGKLEPFKPEEARKARADAFIIKPFEASELLVALTKLEDKIVPKSEPYKQGRFAKAIAAVEESNQGDSFGDSESGWKDRLRFPSGAPKTPEPEPEVEVATPKRKGFRDLLRRDPPKQVESSEKFERPIPAGLPHDITPEEIAAITAAAEKVGGSQKTPAARKESRKRSRQRRVLTRDQRLLMSRSRPKRWRRRSLRRAPKRRRKAVAQARRCRRRLLPTCQKVRQNLGLNRPRFQKRRPRKSPRQTILKRATRRLRPYKRLPPRTRVRLSQLRQKRRRRMTASRHRPQIKRKKKMTKK